MILLGFIATVLLTAVTLAVWDYLDPPDTSWKEE